MKVYWATRLRGFLKHVTARSDKVIFYTNNNYYETNNKKQKVLSKIVRTKLMDTIGLFQIINVKGKECECYASFNRFLKTDKPYFIYLENPTALYHYSINRIKNPICKMRFKKCINDKNLKGIACMSNMCRTTFETINGKLPKNLIIETIYPLVPNNNLVNVSSIKKKSRNDTLELLYSVQGIRFISKGGLEVIESIKDMKNVHLTIITKISDIDDGILQKINRINNVTLLDFNLRYEELEKIYARTNILLHPTSDDSFGLTILEAMKGGCAIIATKLYSIPEIVKDNQNGILIEPKYWFFDKNGIPNPNVWNHRKQTIYSNQVDKHMVLEIKKTILSLAKDRRKLESYSINSYRMAIDDSFLGEKGIAKKWEKFIVKINKSLNN